MANIEKWGDDRNLHDPKAQLNKVIEEVGEIAHQINRQQYGGDLADAVGDTTVTLIILANICGLDFKECLGVAYDAIKDRTGATVNGTFVKEA